MSETEELYRLRATIALVHDHLHHNRINEAHEALHCESAKEASEALGGSNISIDSASAILLFSQEFNRLCAKRKVDACWVALVPSATRRGWHSMQMGGSVTAINWVRQQMGMGPTTAVGDHRI